MRNITDDIYYNIEQKNIGVITSDELDDFFIMNVHARIAKIIATLSVMALNE